MLVQFARSFGIRVDPAGITRAYRAGLADVPAKLLTIAIQRAIASWTWGNRLPMPGDLRKLITDDWDERVKMAGRARLLARRAPKALQAPTVCADPESVKRILADFTNVDFSDRTKGI